MSCESRVCTLEFRYGISVTVLDDAGAPVSNATVTITEDDYIEELDSLGNGVYFGAGERPGEYLVTIEAPAYQQFEQEVIVQPDICHVITESMTVSLIAETAQHSSKRTRFR